VDDAFYMSGVERIGNLDAEIEHRVDLHPFARDGMAERLPLQQFHGDEGSTALLVDLVNCAYVRMIQSGGSLGLALEAAQGLWIAREFVG
jgi:hypothetical protein